MSAPRRPPRRVVDGVLLLDKPAGVGSNSALQQVKRLFNAEKAGHTGTLDPMATGLLPICFGEATKFSSELLDADKSYLATVRLGVATDSGDADGKVVKECPVTCGPDDIARVAAMFRGHITQVPPMFSALKRDGKALYEYARAGIEVDREARAVHIEELELSAFSATCFQMRVRCSKGTYIRSLAMDIGEKLGCGGHLIDLRRLSIGRFTIDQAVDMEQLSQTPVAELDYCLHPVDYLVMTFPEQVLTDTEALRLANGQRFRPSVLSTDEGMARLYAPDRRFLGMGRFAGGVLHPERLLATG